ncbi:MAG: 6-carboxyhexanoate--CoA ligase [Nitrospirae bacterium]|nr:6-carboxyhexanoate--CoA ligase [Nitrospirota bacterium]
MRASSNNIHVTGSERILDEANLANVFNELVCRALSSHIKPDSISINVEKIEHDAICYAESLDIKTVKSPTTESAEKDAKKLLEANGIKTEIINQAFNLLRIGPAAGGSNMRGAIIMDIDTGKRIEPDTKRGVRVSRIDYTDAARKSIEKALLMHDIFHHRVIDAVAIATKVCRREETIAELCWSDNPDYTTGYVASEKSGYVRITNMKEKGSSRGGRVFFVNPEGLSLNDYINYLERQPVIINKIGTVYGS